MTGELCIENVAVEKVDRNVKSNKKIKTLKILQQVFNLDNYDYLVNI